jgi:serine/threonine-protein kinase
MTSTTQLTNDFLKTFQIRTIIEQKPKSGQKQVYIVDIGGKKIALKIIPTIDERIIRELNIYEVFKEVKGIPCVMKIQEYGGELVVLEEYIDGEDLHIIKDTYLNDSKKVRELIFKIANILEPVWDKKYVHRDLKPQNIRINNENPVVLDFGIARDLEDETITPTGFQPFSWPFGTPEQFFYKRDQISYRTDFFCLGIIAYHLFTGGLPFGNTKTDVATTFIGDQIIFDVGELKMNNFLNTVLKFRVAERPRNIEAFIKSLGI